MSAVWVGKAEANNLTIGEVETLRGELERSVQALCEQFIRRTRCQVEVGALTLTDREYGVKTIQVKVDVKLP